MPNDEQEGLFDELGPPAGSEQYRVNQMMGGAYARRTDPKQSHDAARRVAVNQLERLVLETLEKYGPLTVKQIAHFCRKDKWSISPRMKPLETKGRVYRHSKVGREIIWGLTDEPM